MKILWFPRLQADIDRLHLISWRAMAWEITARGHDLRLVVAGDPPGFPPGVLLRLPTWSFRGGRLAAIWIAGPWLAWKQRRVFKPDVVILDPFTGWFVRFWPARGAGRPVILSDHRTPSDHGCLDPSSRCSTWWRSRLDRIAWRRVNSRFDGATVITGYYRQSICRRFKIPAERIAVWGSGVDQSFLHDLPDAVSRPDWFGDQLILIQHGEWSFNRGLLETVQALALCSRKDIRLVLLGQGPAERALRIAAQQWGVADRVTLMPPVKHNEIPGWLDMADFAIMAYPAGEYWNCNCPIKLIEFLARGKAMIATDMPGFREVAGGLPGIFWLKQAQSDAAEIAAAIHTMAEHAGKWRELGRAGRERVVRKFTWARQADRLLEFVAACQRRHGKRQ